MLRSHALYVSRTGEPWSSSSLNGEVNIPATRVTRRARRLRNLSPRQGFAVLVQEASGGVEPELVDALQESANRLVRLDHAMATGHLGAHRTRMQNDHSDPSRLEVVSQGNAGRVQRRLAHAVTVIATRAVVADRPHATRDDRHFRAGLQARRQRSSEKQRRNGVDLELRAHLGQIDVVESVGNEHTGVLDQKFDVVVSEPLGELRPRCRLSHVEPTFDAHSKPVEPRRALSAYGNHTRAPQLELPRELETDP